MESQQPSVGNAVRPARRSQAGSPERIIGAGASLRRGLGSGLLGGILSGLFLLVIGEPAIDEAIRLEHAASSGGHAVEEVFTRGEQHLGMILAAGLYGVAIGGALGMILFVMSRRMGGTAWERSMWIALSGFAAYFLVPFLKYPASPPGMGNPDTIELRTAAYLFLAATSVAACFVGVAMARRLSARGVEAHKRHLIVAACYLLVIGIAFVALPSGEVTEGVPAGLLWDFRMASLGGQAVLWTCTGAILGLLSTRAERRALAAGESRRVTD